MSGLNDRRQATLEKAEERRRAVVAAAKELEALGCGDPFEAPIEPPEPDHASRRDRIEELVDEILHRAGTNPHRRRVDPTHRYSWTSYPADVYGEQLVVSTPEGPVAVASGVYAGEDTPPSPREMGWPGGTPERRKEELEKHAEEQEELNRHERVRLDELHEEVPDGPLRCPECGSTLFRAGEHGEVGPYTLAFCSKCAWRGALYEDSTHALLQERRAADMDPQNRKLEEEPDIEELRERLDVLERVASGWKMLALYRERLLEAANEFRDDIEEHLEQMDEEARDGAV